MSMVRKISRSVSRKRGIDPTRYKRQARKLCECLVKAHLGGACRNVRRGYEPPVRTRYPFKAAFFAGLAAMKEMVR